MLELYLTSGGDAFFLATEFGHFDLISERSVALMRLRASDLDDH